jgi:N-acyl-D-aspartate/D-glutamate deacylase
MTHGACNHEIKRLENELSRLRAENVAKDAEIERLKAILADALEWGMTSKHFDAGRSLKNGEDARAALSRAEQAKMEVEK